MRWKQAVCSERCWMFFPSQLSSPTWPNKRKNRGKCWGTFKATAARNSWNCSWRTTCNAPWSRRLLRTRTFLSKTGRPWKLGNWWTLPSPRLKTWRHTLLKPYSTRSCSYKRARGISPNCAMTSASATQSTPRTTSPTWWRRYSLYSTGRTSKICWNSSQSTGLTTTET